MDTPDLQILGIGMNGHIAMIQPGAQGGYYRTGVAGACDDGCTGIGVTTASGLRGAAGRGGGEGKGSTLIPVMDKVSTF